MSKTVMKTVGDFCWAELATPDVERSMGFYCDLFEWQTTAHTMPTGDQYQMIQLNGCEIGGAYSLSAERAIPPGWSVYIVVADVDTASEQAVSLGARLLEGPYDVGSFGRMAVMQDPTDAIFSLWQGKQGASPQPTPDTIGMPSWHELRSTDLEKASAFYSALFGWEYTDQMFNDRLYRSFTNNGNPVAGMMEKPELWKNDPSHWGIYFTIADLESSIKQAQSMGATLLCEPQAVPGVGRIAMMQDGQAIHFSLFQYETE